MNIFFDGPLELIFYCNLSWWLLLSQQVKKVGRPINCQDVHDEKLISCLCARYSGIGGEVIESQGKDEGNSTREELYRVPEWLVTRLCSL